MVLNSISAKTIGLTLVLLLAMASGHPQVSDGASGAATPPRAEHTPGTQPDQQENESAFGSGIEICESPVQPVTLSNRTTITDCTRAGIQNALNTGGHIDFDCGPNPIAIPIDAPLEISTIRDTVIDGGNLVTLDGQEKTNILHKGWHNPDTIGTVNVTFQNLRFINGKTPGGGSTGDHSGGAISSGHPGTSLHVFNCTFENNTTTDVTTADNQGGAIFSSNSYETVISGSVFDGNSAGNGGAIGGIATGLFVYNNRFSGNHALDTTPGGIVRGYGGAIHLDGVTNSYNPDSHKRVHICGSTFEDNTSVRGGGAIGVVVSDNKRIKATYERSTFSGNAVSGLNGSYGQGGAIYHIEDDHAGGSGEDNLEIVTSTFAGNRAGRQGGAVWISMLGRGDIVNSTFEGNSTTAPYNQVGQGGGLVITLGRIDITNVTFANNHAAYQAGALHGGGSGNPDRIITLKNTVFYNNTLNEQDFPTPTEWQGYHTNRPMEDGGQNIQFPRLKPTYNNGVNNNITANPIYADPLLAPVANNGGPNHTMAIYEDSPALDAGAHGCPPTDQRGVFRSRQCDIGAYELVNAVHVIPTVQAVPPGGVARYAVQLLAGPDHTGPFDLDANAPYVNLELALDPLAIGAGETAMLTVTDTHSGTVLTPGQWHRIDVHAHAAGYSESTWAELLVGGSGIFLPVIAKGF